MARVLERALGEGRQYARRVSGLRGGHGEGGSAGLERTIDELRLYCRKHPDIDALILNEVQPGPTHADAGAKKGKPKEAANNVSGLHGNSPTYAMKRLKRDRPDLFAEVVAGNLSPNAAAVQAGFIRSERWRISRRSDQYGLQSARSPRRARRDAAVFMASYLGRGNEREVYPRG